MAHQKTVKKVCVIGAGTMGSGIAAHLANLGFEVALLDATQPSAVEAFERAKQAKPPRFYVPERSLDIKLGNILENVDWIAEADWVCEAIVERLPAKRSLFARIEPLLRPDAFVSTNTSGIEISLLAEGLSDGFKRRFMGTHFFNPPRYLKLLELIPTPDTDPVLVSEMTRLLEDSVARRVVVAKDTPGFIANRYGMWCMYHAVHVAEKLRLTVEQTDAITGPFMGRPKSATFRLNDIVGLDVMQDIAVNLLERCPNDPHIGTLKTPASMITLMDRGWIGDKSGQGYYRKEAKEFLAFDLLTHAYRQKADVDLPAITELMPLPLEERLVQALSRRCETGEYMRGYLLPILKYADYLKEEISHCALDIDRVMQWGFGWEMGPFEMIDAIGADRLGLSSPSKFYRNGQQLCFDKEYRDIPKEPEYLRLQDCPVVQMHETFNVRDLGDGVSAVCLSTKLGVITPKTVDELSTFILSESLDRFVLTGESRSFSAGFDLRFFSKAISEERWIDIDLALDSLQKLGELLEKSNVVAAIYGHTLGAGLELALSCPKIVTLAETQIGFPEAKVGLLPGGRGVTLMRQINQHTAKRLSEVTFNLATGTVSNNSEEARALGYLRGTDVTVFHPDRLLYEAKKAVLDVEPIPRIAFNTTIGPLSGMIDRLLEVAVSRGQISAYDETIGQKLKLIVAKAANYEDCLTKERTEFLDLCGRALTVARINHMLTNGTPLRN